MNASSMQQAKRRNTWAMTAAVMVAVLFGTFSVPRHATAQAVVCVNCSTIVTQLVSYAEQVLQYEKQVAQYETQLQQYQNMLNNSKSVPQSFFDNALGTVRNIESVMNNASNMRYMMTNLDQQYTQYYPGVYTRLQQQAGLTPQQSLLNSYSRQQTSYDAALTALKAAQMQSNDLQSDQFRMDSIGGTLIGAIGRMDAMQAAGEYGQISAQQLMKMRQLALVQIQLESQRMSTQTNKEDLARANLESWIQNRPNPPMSTAHTSDGF